MPYIHCLTQYGAQVLADYRRVSVDTIIYPKGGMQFQRDIFHRIKVIDYHIRFRQWAQAQGIELSIADLYFDKVGSQRRGGQVSKTRVDLVDGSFIEPDVIFGFRHKGQDFVYVLEYHRTSDTKRIATQITSLKNALPAISTQYQLSVTPYILSIKAKDKRFAMAA